MMPSSIPEPTNTAIVPVTMSLSPCIRADTEHWYASWITYYEDKEDPQVSRKHNNLNCYDFDSKGFVAQHHQENDTWRIRIECGDEGLRCPDEDVVRGIYTYLPWGEYEFEIMIEEIEIIKESQEVNDVDLIIGLGDPIGHEGKFIFFRLVYKSGNVHFCELEGYNYHCDPVATVDPLGFGVHKAKIEVGERSSISLDGLHFGSIEANDPNHNKLWLGYNIRTEGLIDAYIQFPKSLNDYLSIEQ